MLVLPPVVEPEAVAAAGRLHGALPTFARRVLRGRGQLWIASQPDTVIGFESAGGGAGMVGLDRWLAALPELAHGFAAWTGLPDPFAGCFPRTDDNAGPSPIGSG